MKYISRKGGEGYSVEIKQPKYLGIVKKKETQLVKNLVRKQSTCWQITSSGSGIVLSRSI